MIHEDADNQSTAGIIVPGVKMDPIPMGLDLRMDLATIGPTTEHGVSLFHQLGRRTRTTLDTHRNAQFRAHGLQVTALGRVDPMEPVVESGEMADDRVPKGLKPAVETPEGDDIGEDEIRESICRDLEEVPLRHVLDREALAVHDSGVAGVDEEGHLCRWPICTRDLVNPCRMTVLHCDAPGHSADRDQIRGVSDGEALPRIPVYSDVGIYLDPRIAVPDLATVEREHGQLRRIALGGTDVGEESAEVGVHDRDGSPPSRESDDLTAPAQIEDGVGESLQHWSQWLAARQGGKGTLIN